MDLGDAKIVVKVDDKATDKMKRIGMSTEALSKKFRTMGKVMVGVGLAIVGALTAAVISYGKVGDEIAKMAKRTGLAVEMLSELRHVASLTGTDLSSIEKATKKMSKTIVDASDGMATYVRAFEKIGLSAEGLLKLSPEEQFWAIAQAIGALESDTMKAAVAIDIFGRAGTMLLPMLALTTEELAAARQEAHDLGIVFDEEATKKAEAFQDAMLKLKHSLQGVGFAIADPLMPAITEFLEEKVVPTIEKILDWIDANKGLAKGLAILAGVLIGGGGLLLALGMIAKAIIAINRAFLIMHSLSGIGLLKAGLGLAAAAGLIVAMNKLLATETPETPEIPEEPEVPLPETTGKLSDLEKLERGILPHMPEWNTMLKGGIVPGALGAPVPVIAHGGEQFAGVGKTFGGINVYIGSFMGDEASLRAFGRQLKDIIGQDVRRTSFAGINRLEYFPGSSAP